MKPKSIILLVLALGCGLVASLGINQVMADRKDGPGGPEMVSVYVAADNININDIITPEKVVLEEWPHDKLLPGTISKLEDIEGRVTQVRFHKGELILNDKLLAKGDSGAGVGGLIPAGFRTAAVRVDDVTSAGSLIRPGDRVDVLVHVDQNLSRGVKEEVTKTFLQDIRVFAVNDVVVKQAGGEKVAARTISLLVTPSQAQMVTLATEMGRIRLVLRGPDDKNVDEIQSFGVGDLLGTADENDNREQESPATTTPEPANPFTELTPTEVEPAAERLTMTIIKASDVEVYELDETGRQPGRLSEGAGLEVTTEEPAEPEAAFEDEDEAEEAVEEENQEEKEE